MTTTPTMRTRVAGVLVCALVALICAVPSDADAASNWVTAVAAGSKGQARAQALPAAPVASATCSLVGVTITVTWAAIPLATSYNIYQASSSSGPWTLVASGVSGTTWTSTHILGTFYYEVSATIGTNWTGPNSAATAGHTILAILCT